MLSRGVMQPQRGIALLEYSVWRRRKVWITLLLLMRLECFRGPLQIDAVAAIHKAVKDIQSRGDVNAGSLGYCR